MREARCSKVLSHLFLDAQNGDAHRSGSGDASTGAVTSASTHTAETPRCSQLSMCYDLTHTHSHTASQTRIQPGYGIHLSSYVCAIINKAEIAGRRSAAQHTKRGVGGASSRAAMQRVYVNKDQRPAQHWCNCNVNIL